MSATGKIFSVIPKIMHELPAIAKNRKNQAQGYAFRGIDDIYLAVQETMAKHGVFVVPTVLEDHTEERQTSKGTNLIWRRLKIKYTFYADDGSCVDAVVIGEGMDSGDKASNKALSVAQKYAIIQVFCIPTEEPKDPENESHEIVTECYIGTAQQKFQLAKVFKELGILTVEKQKKAALELVSADPKIKMAELSDAVIKLIEAKII